MDIIEYMRREIVRKAYSRGLLLSKDLVDYILYHVVDVDGFIEDLASLGKPVVSLEDLSERDSQREVTKGEGGIVEDTEPETVDTCDTSIRISMNADPYEVEPSSWDRERSRILLGRLDVLGKIILQKGRVSPVSFERALRAEDVKDVMGVVGGVDVSSTGKKIIYLEDGENIVRVLLPPGNKKFSYIEQDMVVAFRVRSNGNLLVAEDVVFPSVTGYVRRNPDCPFRLLVVPDAYRGYPKNLPEDRFDAVVLLSNVVNIYETTTPRADYRRMDEWISSLNKPVFVVPGRYDAVRSIPPLPPIDRDLLPDASSTDNVYMLSSPSILRINGTYILLYDGSYYMDRRRPPEILVYSRLVQPDISTYPYRSSRDFSLLQRMPDLVLFPIGGGTSMVGGVLLVKDREPYIIDIMEGKVIAIERRT